MRFLLALMTLFASLQPTDAEPGPVPREVRLDIDGDILPDGALIRLGTKRYRTSGTMSMFPSEDGKSISLIGRTGCCEMDLETGKPFRRWRLPVWPTFCSSSDSRYLGEETHGTARIWDGLTGRMTYELSAKNIDRYVMRRLSLDGRLLFYVESTGSFGSRLRVRDLSTGSDMILGPSVQAALDILDDNEHLVWSRQKEFGSSQYISTFFNYRSMAQVMNVSGSGSFHIQASRDGKRIFLVDPESGESRWMDMTTGRVLKEAIVPAASNEASERIGLKTLSPDGTYAVFRDAFDRLRLWDCRAGRMHKELRIGGWPQTAFSADGKTLFTDSGIVHTWDMRTGERLTADTESLGPAFAAERLVWHPLINAIGIIGSNRTKDRILWIFSDQGNAKMKRVAVPLPSWMSNSDLLREELPKEQWRGGESEWRYFESQDDRFAAVVNVEGASARVRVYERWSGALISEIANAKEGQISFSSDGRKIAILARDGLYEWDILAQRRIGFRPAPNGILTLTEPFGSSIAYSPDGDRIAVGMHDCTILIWPSTHVRLEAAKLSEVQLDQLWRDLASPNARIAVAAMATLSDSPRYAIPDLVERLKRVEDVSEANAGVLWSEIDSTDYRTRERAMLKVIRTGDAIRPQLKAALGRKISSELRQRLESLIDVLNWKNPPSVNDLRQIRAIAVLERADTVEARRKIEDLADGFHDARVTIEAEATLERLSIKDEAIGKSPLRRRANAPRPREVTPR